MKVHVKFQGIDETFEAKDADAMLHLAKQQAAQRAPFLLRPLINSMSDMAFAAEAVKRANQANGRQDPIPTTAQEFIDWGVQQGVVTIIEP